MPKPLSILTLLLGTIWAEALLVAGVVLAFVDPLTVTRLLPAVALVCMGLLVAMCSVIDPLVPRASPLLVFGLKLVCAVAFVLCCGLMAYNTLEGGWPPIVASL